MFPALAGMNRVMIAVMALIFNVPRTRGDEPLLGQGGRKVA